MAFLVLAYQHTSRVHTITTPLPMRMPTGVPRMHPNLIPSLTLPPLNCHSLQHDPSLALLPFLPVALYIGNLHVSLPPLALLPQRSMLRTRPLNFFSVSQTPFITSLIKTFSSRLAGLLLFIMTIDPVLTGVKALQPKILAIFKFGKIIFVKILQMTSLRFFTYLAHSTSRTSSPKK